MAAAFAGSISQVKLPSGSVYEIKDAKAREMLAGNIMYHVADAVGTTPSGVTWSKNGTSVTGTLTAANAYSAAVAAGETAFYLVPNGAANGNGYDEYVVAKVGSSWQWERLGSKDIDLSPYLLATTAESTYVKKSGDTMTGNLTVPGINAGDGVVSIGSSGIDVGCGATVISGNGVSIDGVGAGLTFGCASVTGCGDGVEVSAGDNSYRLVGDNPLVDDSVIRKSDLGAWAFASGGSVSVPATFSLSIAGTVPKNPTGGTAAVHKWKLGTETTKNVTFTQLSDQTVTTGYQYQPAGDVSAPTISVSSEGSTKTFKGIVSTFSGTSVVAALNAGSWSAGSWTAGSYTAGSAFSRGTLPTLTMTMDTTDTEQLNISFSQGSLPSYTPPTCTLPTCTLPTVKTMATLESITAKTGDASYTASAPTFTGKKCTVTSVYPGALATDGTENATVTLTAASGTDSVTFGTKTISIASREDRLVAVPAASGATA